MALALRDELWEDLQEVRLFGSVVRGEASTESDVDLLIVARPGADDHAISRIVGEAISESGQVVSPLVVTPDEFSALMTSSSPFSRALRSQSEALA